ncbi:MAG: DUF222 domain-containing protein [Halieaceae bacterium]|jgi:hypothetical protein|nr:DUF222 domain-containing protein [Halieaceae bacterium]
MTAALPAEIFPKDIDSLGNEITLLAGQINAANYRFLKLIAEFDRRSGWNCDGTVRNCAHWLNWKCGIDKGAAREKIRVARRLDELPMINAAFAAGEVSYSKVRAMTRVATNENEQYLLNIAHYGTASHVELVVRKFQRVRRQCADDNDALQQAERELRYYQDDDGMWVISARLPAEEGELLVKAIETVVQGDLKKEDYKRIGEKAEDAEQGCNCNTKCVSETFPRKPQVSDETLDPAATPTTIPQHRADAIARLAEHFIATAGENDELATLKGADRCQVVLQLTLDDLKGGESPPMHPSTLKRLSCDASVVTAIEDSMGNLLNMGRKTRTVPPAMRRALLRRDETCRFPGCCESRYVDAHHVQHWSDGGETCLENLVTLCKFHHRALHNGSFSIAVTGDGESTGFGFLDQEGMELPRTYPDACCGEEALDSLREEVLADAHIDANTAVTHWAGECLDYDMAMDGLLQREHCGQLGAERD